LCCVKGFARLDTDDLPAAVREDDPACRPSQRQVKAIAARSLSIELPWPSDPLPKKNPKLVRIEFCPARAKKIGRHGASIAPSRSGTGRPRFLAKALITRPRRINDPTTHPLGELDAAVLAHGYRNLPN
jgi:hypothetical protein